MCHRALFSLISRNGLAREIARIRKKEITVKSVRISLRGLFTALVVPCTIHKFLSPSSLNAHNSFATYTLVELVWTSENRLQHSITQFILLHIIQGWHEVMQLNGSIYERLSMLLIHLKVKWSRDSSSPSSSHSDFSCFLNFILCRIFCCNFIFRFV